MSASLRKERRSALVWSYVFLVLFAVVFLTPPLYMFITSLKTSAEISSAKLHWWVFDPTLDNYTALLTSESYLTFFRNSAVVSLAVVAITMAISIPAAFSLSRMRFWGSGALAAGVFLTYLIPETLLFSLIVTFANFDIVRILTNGGPIDQTHVFATWAFQLGIEGGDLPLGACVSLFMFPILGVAAYFILRDINRRGTEA